MKPYPTTGLSSSVMIQNARPARRSRSSLASSGATGARATTSDSRESKKHVLEPGRHGKSSCDPQGLQGARAAHASAREQDEAVADPLRVRELMDSQKLSSTGLAMTPQESHHGTSLVKIEAVERLVHGEHGLRGEESDPHEQPAPVA